VAAVLVVNAGSTSLKLHAVEVDGRSIPVESFADAPDGLAAVAHRVVHGGPRFRDPIVIDSSVRNEIRELIVLAPLHNAPALDAIDAARQALPDVPHIAVFDTSFHRTIPPEAAEYAVPKSWREEWGIRRYGFQGLSVEWCATRVPELVGAPVHRLVVCHLGGGSSVTAVVDGRSVDTTMGFTPLEGLVMATRSGDVDPGLLIWLQRHADIGPDELDDALEHRSGVAGLSGLSGDMQELLEAVDGGNERARLAYDVYVHRLRAQIAGMVASAGGIDVLVFTGGIGEHSERVRTDACAGLTPIAGATVLVIEAREDLELAAQAEALLSSSP
jgi:acetate kinase